MFYQVEVCSDACCRARAFNELDRHGLIKMRNTMERSDAHSLNNHLFKVSLLADAIQRKVEPLADPELNDLLERIQQAVEAVASSTRPSRDNI